MTKGVKLEGKARSCRLTIYVPKTILDASAMDRETFRLNDKMNRMLEIMYLNGGRTDSIEILRAELRAEIGRLEAQLKSLDVQQEAVEEAHHVELNIKKNEDAFIDHVRQARDRAVDWKVWLHAGRVDVKLIGGIQRAKQLMKQEGIDG